MKMKDKEVSTISRTRVEWIDFAKGLTLLLTIIGHSVSIDLRGSWLSCIIFSFHMPLFFILSAATFQFSVDESDWKAKSFRAGKHLILPALFCVAVYIVWDCLYNSAIALDPGYWKGKIYTILFASGVNNSFSSLKIMAIGMPWFFFALFFGRSIYDYLHLN